MVSKTLHACNIASVVVWTWPCIIASYWLTLSEES